MRKDTYIQTENWAINEPMDNESYPENSILPERYSTISEPTKNPITSDDLNSITAPLNIKSDYHETIDRK